MQQANPFKLRTARNPHEQRQRRALRDHDLPQRSGALAVVLPGRLLRRPRVRRGAAAWAPDDTLHAAGRGLLRALL